MKNAFYTVVIYDNQRDKLDYEYPNQYSTVDEAITFIESHGQDPEFSLIVAEHNLDTLEINYIG